MKVTVEISLYPLDSSYESKVIAFIQRLNKYNSITCLTNSMSTYVKGDFKEVMDVLHQELSVVFEESLDYSTVIKILPQDLPIEQGYIDFT